MEKTNANGKGIRGLFEMIGVLLRSIPKYVSVGIVVTVILMNFLANYTVLSLPWLALNAGVFVSWLSFLFMDIVTKHFGLKAGNILSVIAILANTVVALIFYIISKIGTNPSLDIIFGGQWSILLASTIAFILSAFVNNLLNTLVGKLFKKNPDGKPAFYARTYVSTFVGQVVDNFMFVFLAFFVLSRIEGACPVFWTVEQCIGASITCALAELLFEVVFSPLGYMIVKKWENKGIGKEYNERYNNK